MSVVHSISTLVIVVSYIELSTGIDTPFAHRFNIEPGNTTVALNLTKNVTFQCTCMQCGPPLHWSVSIGPNNIEVPLSTQNDGDILKLAKRGILTVNHNDESSTISIPDDTVDNNCTQIRCAAFIEGGIEFSDPVKLTIIGPPLPPDPVLIINSSSQLDIQWEIPYAHENYSVERYNIQITNTSSGDSDVLKRTELQFNETSYTHIFQNKVKYCQILTVNVTAISVVGPSVPGSVSRGFPIEPHTFELDNDDVEVTFLRNGTPMASISFEAPLICDYQTASYTLMIVDITDPTVDLAPIKSTYTGGNRNVKEVVALTIDHNYTLFISVVEDHFGIELSQSINFTTTFQSRDTGHLPHNLGIYIGVPIAVLLFLLLAAIITVVILVSSIVRKRKEWRVARGGGSGVQASSPASVYETINDYQTHQEVKANIHLSPQQQEFLWKVQHQQHGRASRPRNDDSSYQEMMSSAATEGIRVTTGGATFIYPPYTAANQQNAISRPGNPYTQQPCPAAAGSSASPVFGHTVTVTSQPSPTMVVLQERVGGGGVFLEDDDQEYTAMSQAGTLTSQQSSRTVTVAQQQGHSASGVDGNAALPMYSVVNKGEPSKSQNFMVTEC